MYDNIEDVLTQDEDVPAEETVETDESSEETPEESPKPETVLPEQETPEDFSAIDPNKLPPEIQKYYKGMQSAFTKKMQGLQNAMESMGTHKTRLELMDRAIAGDPEARARLAELAGQREVPQGRPETDEAPEDFPSFKDMQAHLDKRFQTTVKGMMEEMYKTHIAPLQERLRNQQINAEIEMMRQKYPDFDEAVPKILEVRERNKGMTLEDSYKLATRQEPVAPTQRTMKPGKLSSAVRPTNGKQPSTFKEAWELTRKELGIKD